MSKKTKKQSTIAKSNPFKVVLPVAIGLVVAAVVAVIIAVATKPATSAKVSNPKETYVNIGDYKVSKQEMYEALKSGSGLNTLQEIVDTDLLAGVTVSEEEASTIKEELIYGAAEKYEDMTSDEVAEAREKALRDFNAGLESMGYLTDEEKSFYIDLQVKRYKYGFDQLVASKTTDYTDEEYKAAFTAEDSKYEDSVTALVIPFTGEDQLKAYLELVNVDPATYTKAWNRLSDVKKNNETNEAIATLKEELAALEDEGAKEAKQAEIDAKTAELLDADALKLSEKEITLAYIQLYNLVNAYRKGFDAFDADNKLIAGKEILQEGTHYTVGENEVTFNIDAIKALETEKLKLTYTKAEAIKVDGSETTDAAHGALNAILFDELKLASEIEVVEGEEKPELPVTHLESLHKMTNGLNYLAYKLAATKGEEVDETALAEAKATLKEQMIKEEYNTDVETKYLIELRQAYELVIYDKFINASYEAAYTYLYETTFALEAGKYPEYTGAGKKSKTLAFAYKVNGQTKEVSADDYFKALSSRYGAQAIIPKINSYALLSNKDYNVVFNPYNGKVYNKEAYKNLKNSFNIYNLYYNGQLTTLKEFKYAFENDVFSTYGFDKDYGWANFEKDYMLLQNDDQLIGSLAQSQANTLFNLTQISSDELQTEMKKIQDEYYSMKVVNMLITVDYDLNNAPDTYELAEGKEQKYWTAEQIELAKALMEDLYSYKDGADETATTLEAKLKAITNQYTNATVNDSTWGKYIQAGLAAKVESAADYTSESGLVEEFHVAMRGIYATLEMGKEDTEAGLGQTEAFPTVYGMHKVAVLKTTEGDKYDVSTLNVDLFKKHITGEEISEDEEKAIEKYLEPAINNIVTTNVNAKFKFALRQSILDVVSSIDSQLAADFTTYTGLYRTYINKLITEEKESK